MKIIYIRPIKTFTMLGTAIKITPEEVYPAVIAKNLPEWKERGQVYVGGENGLILETGEYVIVKGYKPKFIEDEY
jgi:hypothetical protein